MLLGFVCDFFCVWVFLCVIFWCVVFLCVILGEEGWRIVLQRGSCS